MKKLVLTLVIAIMVGATAQAQTQTQAQAEDTPRRITVTGTGHVEVMPDMATLSVGVTKRADQAGEALASASAAAAAILKQLQALGIAPRDIQTRRVTLNPIWSDSRASSGPRHITGYRADNAISVRIRDLSGLGTVIDAVVAAGSNDFNGLAFSVQKEEALRNRARQNAVRDAMAKAALLAEAAGITLGPVISMTEGGTGIPQPRGMEMAAMADSVPVASGEVSIRASVSMVFSIGD